MSKIAVLIIDMLKDFLEEWGALYCKHCREIVPSIQRLIKESRKRKIPIVYVCDSHPTKLSDHEFKKWKPHAIRGTKGAEVIDELKPQEGDFIVFKRTYDGFYNTELEITLRSLGVETVIVTGIHTHVCILATATAAFCRGFHVIVPEDCVTTSHPENHRTRIRYFQSHLGEVVKLNELLERLDGLK
jgi:nicotinamidase-related amidase